MRISLGKLSLASVFAGAAFVVALWSVVPGPHPGEASLRDVSGIEVQPTDLLVFVNGATVECRVENKTKREASSVVFQVEVTTEDGRILAANPLGNTLRLKPGESRAVQVPMPPVPEPPHSVLTRAQVSLVRWHDAAR